MITKVLYKMTGWNDEAQQYMAVYNPQFDFGEGREFRNLISGYIDFVDIPSTSFESENTIENMIRWGQIKYRYSRLTDDTYPLGCMVNLHGDLNAMLPYNSKIIRLYEDNSILMSGDGKTDTDGYKMEYVKDYGEVRVARQYIEVDEDQEAEYVTVTVGYTTIDKPILYRNYHYTANDFDELVKKFPVLDMTLDAFDGTVGDAFIDGKTALSLWCYLPIGLPQLPTPYCGF